MSLAIRTSHRLAKLARETFENGVICQRLNYMALILNTNNSSDIKLSG